MQQQSSEQYAHIESLFTKLSTGEKLSTEEIEELHQDALLQVEHDKEFEAKVLSNSITETELLLQVDEKQRQASKRTYAITGTQYCRLCESNVGQLSKHFEIAHRATENEIRALYGWNFGEPRHD